MMVAGGRPAGPGLGIFSVYKPPPNQSPSLKKQTKIKKARFSTCDASEKNKWHPNPCA